MNEILDEFCNLREDVWEQFKSRVEGATEILSRQTGLDIKVNGLTKGLDEATLVITLPAPFDETTLRHDINITDILDVEMYEEAIYNTIECESDPSFAELIANHCDIDGIFEKR